MVAKINGASSIYGVLAYNQQKVDSGHGRVLCANLIMEPADGKFNVPDCVADFQMWMPAQIRAKEPMLHISLNPHPDDRLTDEQLAAISREYIERLGYGYQPYIVFKHEDIDRQHIHIVASAINKQGGKIKDNFIRLRSKEITEDLERKYNLHPAEGQKRGEVWQLSPVDTAAGDIKRQIAAVIKPLCSMYSFQSFSEYRALLSLYNIGVEEVRGTVNDKPYRGLIYSALDARGNKVGTPLKSSLFGRKVGYDELEKHFIRSGEKIKRPEYLPRIRGIVATALRYSRTDREFREALREKGIDLVLRYTDKGRIYGATYIDHRGRSILNGSALGKAFSANALNERFGDETPLTPVRAAVADDNTVMGGLLSVLTPEIEDRTDEGQLPILPKKKKRRLKPQ